jgi:hypothetical protein
MGRMGMKAEELADLVGQFRTTLLEMDERRIERGGQPRRRNQLVDRLQVLHLRLRSTPEGRLAITAISDENLTMRQWSSTFALFWETAVAREELERQAADPSKLTGVEAEITLREFGAGRLNTVWQPKGRSP